jgi:hypothetical protein
MKNFSKIVSSAKENLIHAYASGQFLRFIISFCFIVYVKHLKYVFELGEFQMLFVCEQELFPFCYVPPKVKPILYDYIRAFNRKMSR